MYDLATFHDERFDTGVDFSSSRSSRKAFHAAKRVFDIVISIVLLPFLILISLGLLVLNPFYNKGSLFFVQTRMGRNCKAFKAIKFRSMTDAGGARTRSADDPLEVDRITPLGRFLRRSRFDELPQIINVFKGDMSLIGPRPDSFAHARRFIREVPGYRARHLVRPGISGLAQTELGYAEGIEATRKKVRADLYYIANTSPMLEAWIFWRTVSVVARRGGA